MAASTFAQACDALVRERDRVFLLRVSADYNIPFAELEAKYLTESEAAIKVPKQKKPREARVIVEGERCQAMTAKKGQCSFSALKGECYCKRHLKQQNEPKQEIPKPVKPEPKKPAAKVEPEHNHEIDGAKRAECDLCQTHGTALNEDAEFEEMVESDSESEGVPAGSASESEFDDE